MKTFLKIIKGFFMFLGVIFFIILLFVAYLWFFDPLNIKPVLFSSSTGQTIVIDSDDRRPDFDAHPLLDNTQEKMLESVGINPSSLPAEITPEMEACFAEALGGKRVTEIKNGDPVSIQDVIKAKDCLK